VVSRQQQFLNIVEALLDLALLQTLGHDAEDRGEAISLDRVQVLPPRLPVQAPNLDGDPPQTVEPPDGRTALALSDLAHFFGWSAALLGHPITGFEFLVPRRNSPGRS
jgi:hypothetical protein